MTLRALALFRPCSGIWLLLVALTLLTFTLGGTALDAGLLTPLLLGIALIKAQLVADHFMGLRRVAGFWRPLLAVYLLILGIGIGLAFMSV